jgi:hypothetical protein
MSRSIHHALSVAVLALLRPLVRLLIRHGMAYGTFAELARKAYVEEGFDEIRQSGKRPTVSAVSALTGLTRKESKRLRESEIIGDEASSNRYSRAIRVVSAWLTDPRFQTADGEPAVLPYEGGAACFTTLMKDYSGDIPPAAMLSVLETSNTVRSSPTGIELLSRAYIPSDTPLDTINILGSDVAELTSAISHNISAGPEELWFQRKVSNVLVPPKMVPAFRELSNRKSQELLEEYHAWLSSNERDQGELEDPWYVAVGIYYVEHEISSGEHDESV